MDAATAEDTPTTDAEDGNVGGVVSQSGHGMATGVNVVPTDGPPVVAVGPAAGACDAGTAVVLEPPGATGAAVCCGTGGVPVGGDITGAGFCTGAIVGRAVGSGVGAGEMVGAKVGGGG